MSYQGPEQNQRGHLPRQPCSWSSQFGDNGFRARIGRSAVAMVHPADRKADQRKSPQQLRRLGVLLGDVIQSPEKPGRQQSRNRADRQRQDRPHHARNQDARDLRTRTSHGATLVPEPEQPSRTTRERHANRMLCVASPVASRGS